MTFYKMINQNDSIINDESKWQYSKWWVKMTLEKMIIKMALDKMMS